LRKAAGPSYSEDLQPNGTSLLKRTTCESFSLVDRIEAGIILLTMVAAFTTGVENDILENLMATAEPVVDISDSQIGEQSYL
jgi:hypothetical protein